MLRKGSSCFRESWDQKFPPGLLVLFLFLSISLVWGRGFPGAFPARFAASALPFPLRVSDPRVDPAPQGCVHLPWVLLGPDRWQGAAGGRAQGLTSTPQPQLPDPWDDFLLPRVWSSLGKHLK